MPKILPAFSQSKPQTYFTHALYLLLHIACPQVCEYKSACMPRVKDLSVGYSKNRQLRNISTFAHSLRQKSMVITCPDLELSLDPVST